MSRSYKKTPYVTDGHPRSTHMSKKLIARKFRRQNLEDAINGSLFKKFHCSYDIHDWKSRETEAEARRWYRTNKNSVTMPVWYESFFEQYPTEDIFINKRWAKYFKRK